MNPIRFPKSQKGQLRDTFGDVNLILLSKPNAAGWILQGAVFSFGEVLSYEFLVLS
jgi:hypothetical protein